MATRGLTGEEAALRVDAQPPQEEKAALADRVFVNDGDLRRSAAGGGGGVDADPGVETT